MELQRRKPESMDLDMVSEDPFVSVDTGRGGPVTVCYGPFAEQLPVGGESIRRIRELYADRFDLDPESLAVVDGRDVDDDTILTTGQLLTFIRRAGEKGIDEMNIVAINSCMDEMYE